jgi:hypothetical protein
MNEAPRLPLSHGACVAIDEIVKIFAGFQDALAPANEACDAVISAMGNIKSGKICDADVDRMQKALGAVSALSRQADRMALLEPLHRIVLSELENLL